MFSRYVCQSDIFFQNNIKATFAANRNAPKTILLIEVSALLTISLIHSTVSCTQNTVWHPFFCETQGHCRAYLCL